jgi:hypothetical protein
MTRMWASFIVNLTPNRSVGSCCCEMTTTVL